MSLVAYVVLALGALFLALNVGLQLWMARRAAALKGSRAPELTGELGTAVRGDAILFFHSPSCGPCRAMHPTVDRFAKTDARVKSVDVTLDGAAAMAFGVMATPTTIVVRDGVVVDSQLGMIPPPAFAAMVASLG